MVNIDELRAAREKIEQRIEKLERSEQERQKRCDEIAQELVHSCSSVRADGSRLMVARAIEVIITGSFPDYYFEVGLYGAGSKRTLLEAVRCAAEIIERDTRQ